MVSDNNKKFFLYVEPTDSKEISYWWPYVKKHNKPEPKDFLCFEIQGPNLKTAIHNFFIKSLLSLEEKIWPNYIVFSLPRKCYFLNKDLLFSNNIKIQKVTERNLFKYLHYVVDKLSDSGLSLYKYHIDSLDNKNEHFKNADIIKILKTLKRYYFYISETHLESNIFTYELLNFLNS